MKRHSNCQHIMLRTSKASKINEERLLMRIWHVETIFRLRTGWVHTTEEALCNKCRRIHMFLLGVCFQSACNANYPLQKLMPRFRARVHNFVGDNFYGFWC